MMPSLKYLPRSVKRLPIFSVLMVYIFICSGFIITLACLVGQVLWIINKTLYRKLMTKLAFFLFGQMIWSCIDWADTQVTLFGTDEAYHRFGKESCLVTLSHRGDFDWLVGFVVSACFDFLETIRTLPKKSVLYVPGFGQMLWALECPFLNRSWQKDEANIRKSLKAFADYPFPIQVCIFCEGTRFTDIKLLEGVEYAKRVGLTPLKYHLVPRTKGYAILADSLKKEAHFKLSYDIGFAYPTGQDYYNGHHLTLRDVMAGNTIKVFLYLRKIPMLDLPDSMDDLQKYCHQLYIDKDNAYHYFTQHGRYPGPSRPLIFSSYQLWCLRLNQIFWTILTFVLPTLWLLNIILSTSNAIWLLIPLIVVLLTYLVRTGLLLYAQTSQKKVL